MIRFIKLESGEIIFLGDTSGPISGTCLVCGTRMHAMTSPLGTRYAAVNKGCHHTDPMCLKVDQMKRTPDLSKTDFKSLIPSLLQNAHPHGISPHDGHGHSEQNDDPHDKVSEKEAPKLVPIRSLMGLAYSGVLNLGPFYKFGNDEILADYILRPSWLADFRSNSIPIVGSKVIEGFLGGIKEGYKSIYINMSWPRDGGGKYHAHFQIRGSEAVFDVFATKYCGYEVNEYGRTKLVYQAEKHVLVAGTWDRVTCDPMQCGNHKRYGCESCLGFFSSPLTSLSQIYPNGGRNGKH